MDHSRAPVLESIVAFRERGDLVFSPPGHKQGRGVDPRVADVLGAGTFLSDILALNGLDDRRMSRGVLEDAQDLMADAVHADHAFFSTCGSSLSVKSAMISVAGPYEKLLVNRNSHKSVIAGLIIAGIRPIWVEPCFDEQLQIAHPPTAEEVDRRFREHPDAKGMLLVSPTDYGVCADLSGIARVCHEHDRPLIVDEAWACHFPFHDDLPTWAMDAGADLCVTSVHKAGAGLEQSSVFHLRGNRVDPSVLKQREDLLGTTSSSSLMYAALDGWRRQMVEQGAELLGRAIALADQSRKMISELPGLSVMTREVLERPGAADLDPFKICIDVTELGVSGFQAAEWLRSEHQLALGLADHRQIEAMVTHADDEGTIERLLAGLTELSKRAGSMEKQPPVHIPPLPAFELELVVLPRDAFFGRVEQVPAEQAVGRIAAEMASPYPPGVPVILPGERITAEIVDYLRSGVEAGMLLPDIADSSAKTFKVLVEE